MNLFLKFAGIIAVSSVLINLFSFNANALTGVDLGVSAQAYVLIEADSGQIIASNNENEKMAMASTTKIMTALITLEQEELDEYFKVDNDAIMVEGSSMGLLPDDEVSLNALAIGMLLSSGNDAANAAAVKIGGNQTEFVKMMNEKAKAFGMTSTNFQNPTGLYHEEHYSTASDMAILTQNALKNDMFREICSSEKMSLLYGKPPYKRTLSNHNKLLQMYDGAIGVKTGFTKKAGRCLVSAAERDGTRLICVTLNAPNDWVDHTSLMDYGFGHAKKLFVGETSQNVLIDVVGGVKNQVNSAIGGSSELTFFGEQDFTNINSKVIRDKFVYAPIKTGDKVGRVEYYLGEQLIAVQDLLATEDVEYKAVEEEIGFFRKLYNLFFNQSERTE